MSTNMLVLRRNTDKHFAFDRFSNNTGTLTKNFEYETTDKDFASIRKVTNLERHISLVFLLSSYAKETLFLLRVVW